jgi:hypothetical protein
VHGVPVYMFVFEETIILIQQPPTGLEIKHRRCFKFLLHLASLKEKGQ